LPGTRPLAPMPHVIEPKDLCEPEWAEWYRLTPQERWRQTQKLWQTFLTLGGSLDPEPDTQSPFFDAGAPGPLPADGRPLLTLAIAADAERLDHALREEEQREREADRRHWEPLRAVLERLRHESRLTEAMKLDRKERPADPAG